MQEKIPQNSLKYPENALFLISGLLLLEMSGMPLKNNGGANITIRSAKAASNEEVLYGQSIPYKGKEYTLIEQLHSLLGGGANPLQRYTGWSL